MGLSLGQQEENLLLGELNHVGVGIRRGTLPTDYFRYSINVILRLPNHENYHTRGRIIAYDPLTGTFYFFYQYSIGRVRTTIVRENIFNGMRFQKMLNFHPELTQCLRCNCVFVKHRIFQCHNTCICPRPLCGVRLGLLSITDHNRLTRFNCRHCGAHFESEINRRFHMASACRENRAPNNQN